MNIHILVVEDDPTIAEFLKVGLKYEGFDVIHSANAKECLNTIKRGGIDLVILDILLPDMNGFEVCKKIRFSNSDIPVIMVTVKNDIKDKIEGLNVGADDYITKPFSFDELLARIKAVLRRYAKLDKKLEISSSGIVLNLETHEVYVDSKPVSLTPTEFSLLEVFMKNPQKVFTRDVLIETIFGYDYIGQTNVVDVHISNLRDKIKDKPAKLIVTVYGLGYKFQPRE